MTTTYNTANVNGTSIFYRVAGPKDAPIVLLLHGYPSSSRMFEPLLPRLGNQYRLIAPDYPGFGLSQAPDRPMYEYTFEHLAQTMCQFTDVLGLQQYSLFMQDYGGPVGFRMALARPERVQALIIQNAVLHEEGLTPAWNLRRAYWNNRAEYEAKIREGMVSVQAGMARHIGDRPNPEHFNPDLWMDEIAFLKRPGMERLDEVRTSVLVVMGEKDPDFPDPAIEARWIADQVKGELLMVPGAGHYPQPEFPEVVSPAAVEFVRRGTFLVA